MRILLVDDDLILSKNFANILEDQGYAVETVHDGNTAVLKVSSADFDLVFLDMKLPDIDGAETYRRIKEIKPGINVIVISAFPFEKIITDALEGGVLEYFSKPFDVNAVLSTVAGIDD